VRGRVRCRCALQVARCSGSSIRGGGRHKTDTDKGEFIPRVISAHALVTWAYTYRITQTTGHPRASGKDDKPLASVALLHRLIPRVRGVNTACLGASANELGPSRRVRARTAERGPEVHPRSSRRGSQRQFSIARTTLGSSMQSEEG
jgi:hypothetical protein